MRAKVIVQLSAGVVQHVEVEKGGPELDVIVLEDKLCPFDKPIEITSGFYKGSYIYSQHESEVANPVDTRLVFEAAANYKAQRDANSDAGMLDLEQFDKST